MEISARSYLTAGMAAVVGAGAIAMAPALPSATLHSVALPAPTVAEIALTGTSLPLEQIWTLVQTLGTGGSLSDIVNGAFGAVGTEFITEAMPLVTAVATDVAGYLGSALTGVIGSGGLLPDFPGILSGVGASLGAGDFPGALKAVNDGLSAPLTRVVQTVFGADFQAFLTGKVGTVLGALPEILRSAVQKVLGLDIKPVTDAISAALSNLLPAPAPAAAVALAAVEAAPTVASDIPAIRPTEQSAPAVVAEAPAAPAAPAAAAGVAADAPAESAPAKVEAVEVPGVSEDALMTSDSAVETQAPKLVHRGGASAGESSTSGADHRGAGQAAAGVSRAAR